MHTSQKAFRDDGTLRSRLRVVIRAAEKRSIQQLPHYSAKSQSSSTDRRFPKQKVRFLFSEPILTIHRIIARNRVVQGKREPSPANTWFWAREKLILIFKSFSQLYLNVKFTSIIHTSGFSLSSISYIFLFLFFFPWSIRIEFSYNDNVKISFSLPMK